MSCLVIPLLDFINFYRLAKKSGPAKNHSKICVFRIRITVYQLFKFYMYLKIDLDHNCFCKSL